MTAVETTQVASEISQRISQLEQLSSTDLKNEMQALKKTIMDNPAACLLLKEEDIGLLVSSLRKITGQAIVSSQTKTKAKTAEKTKKLSAAELAAALDDEDF